MDVSSCEEVIVALSNAGLSCEALRMLEEAERVCLVIKPAVYETILKEKLKTTPFADILDLLEAADIRGNTLSAHVYDDVIVSAATSGHVCKALEFIEIA